MNIKQSLTLFGLTDAATQKELQMAYRQGVRHWHPDRFQQAEESVRQAAEQKMRELNIAFELLNAHIVKYGHLREVSSEPAIKKPARNSYYRPPPPPPPRTPPVVEEDEIEDMPPIQPRRSRRSGILFGLAFSAVAAGVIFFDFLPEPEGYQFTDYEPVTPIDKPAVQDNESTTESNLASGEMKNKNQDEIALPGQQKKPTGEPEAKTAFDTRSIFTKQQPTEPDRSYFTYGDSMGKVYEVQGIPTSTEEDIWYYGESMVQFKNGRVVAWENKGKPMLKARF